MVGDNNGHVPATVITGRSGVRITLYRLIGLDEKFER